MDERSIEFPPETKVEALPLGRGFRFELPAESPARRALLEAAMATERTEVLVRQLGGPYLVLQYSIAPESGLTTFDLVEPIYYNEAVAKAFASEVAESEIDQLKHVLFDLDIAFHVESFVGPPENHAISGTKNILEVLRAELSFDADGHYLGSIEFSREDGSVRTLR